jgi:hypothetical protein
VTRKRKNAGKGFGMMFHGAFGSKTDAKRKEREVHGFIQPRNIKGERRYVVMSERKNPIKRKKKAPKPNPHELIVMGANPGATHENREITLPPGATITIRMNPSAEAIREDFTGMPVDRERVRHEPHMPAGDYAQLGKLLILYVKPLKGSQVLEIRAKNVLVVSDESARQLWFVGGDQDVTDALGQFGAEQRTDGLYELGEARRIDYEQRKEHVKDPEQDHWRHEFGEETGERPTVLFDAKHKRLLLEGGAYEIRREGIVN